MMNPGTRFLPLLPLLLAFGCDVDEYPIDLDDDERAAILAVDDAPRDRHCVVAAQPVEAATAPAPASAAPICFDRFADAIHFATGETISADTMPASYSPRPIAADPRDPSALNYIIAVEYWYSTYGGASLTVTATETCATKIFGIPALSASWQNRIQSAKAYAGCKHALHFTSNNYAGAVYDCGTSCSFSGTPVAGQISSIRWSK
jgi:hypothetical protein